METLKWELEKVERKSDDRVQQIEKALEKQKKVFEDKLSRGLEEKGRDIEKLNDNLME